MTLVVIGLLGAVGTILRYIIHLKFNTGVFAGGFPVGTLIVNIVGSSLAGLLFGGREALSQWFSVPFVLALGFGFLGALTTFSSFSIETIRYLEAGHLGMASLNVLANILLSLLFCYLGLRLGIILTHS